MKETILRYLDERGADLVGVASAEAWDREGRVAEPYRPRSIWAPTRSVIVIGMQMPLPIVETTPSTQHTELYRSCNQRLDNLAFDLTRWLNRRGCASIFLSRDGYSRIEVLIEKPAAAFAHNFAAEYAGLGTVGVNHTILSREFGPRVRFVSVFTDAELPPDTKLQENLCIRCGACVECCPVQAFSISKDELSSKAQTVVADYDKVACARRHKLLRDKGCYPCGICVKVCPVGEDRKLYGRQGVLRHYREEAAALERDPDDPAYRSWVHVRRHGSSPLEAERGQPRGRQDGGDRVSR